MRLLVILNVIKNILKMLLIFGGSWYIRFVEDIFLFFFESFMCYGD